MKIEPIDITWKEFHGLVEHWGTLLVNEDDRGYMELEVPMDYNSDDPELWRNCNEGMEDREDLLCLHVYATSMGHLNCFTASVGMEYYIELPPDFMIAVESTGRINVPYSFDVCGEPLDYLTFVIMDTAHLYPVRSEDELFLVREEDANTEPTQP